MPHPAKNREPRTQNLHPRRNTRFSLLGSQFTIYNLQFSILQLLVHIACWVPLAVLIWDGLHNQLTANPIQEITFRTGKTALILLVLSLLCTPANIVLGFKQALVLRRPLGLYAFFYVCLHLFTFAVIDYGLDWELIQQAIVEKRYVLVGFTAFLLLLPLAITLCCCYRWRSPLPRAGSGAWASAGSVCTGWSTWPRRWPWSTSSGW
jgi:hypothetical protein